MDSSAVRSLALLACTSALHCIPHLRPRHAARRALPMAALDAETFMSGEFWTALSTEARTHAGTLGLTVKSMRFEGGKLKVSATGAGIDELSALGSRLSSFIDNVPPEQIEELPSFSLEVGSPGLGSLLETDLDFATFKGFPVTVELSEPLKGKTSWDGTLLGRDDEAVTLNLKGALKKLPRALVASVALPPAKFEPGDRG